MIKYLSLVFDLMDIPLREQYLEIGRYIEDHPKVSLVINHPYGFIFVAFADLVNGKITEEEFVALGDTYSHSPVQQHQVSVDSSTLLESLDYGLETDSRLYTNTLFVVSGVSPENLAHLQEKLLAIDSMLFVL